MNNQIKQTIMELPFNLVDAFKENRVAVFIGAGASVGVGLPGWNELVADLAKQLKIQPDAGPKKFSPSLLNKIPQYYENKFGRLDLIRRLEILIKHHEIRNSPVHDLIAELSSELFYTTNFDELLEEALYNQEIEFDKIASESTARAFTERRRCQIRKIHGTISQPETLVITRLDYARINEERRLMIETLRNDLYSHVFLFIGYSLSDPDFNSIYDHVFNTMKDMTQRHFICTLSASLHEEEDLAKRNLTSTNIGSWPGNTPNDKLIAFLTNLVEATSETIHIKRFFRIKKGQNLPVVVNSHMHEIYHYNYYPECDINVAQQIEKVLNRIGCTSQIIAGKMAIEKPDDYLYSDLILVCGPYSNQFTKYVYEKAEIEKTPFDQRFENIECIFSWDKIRGNDNERLIEFLIKKFGIDLIKEAEIEKIDDKTIIVRDEKNSIYLSLNREKMIVNLKIDDDITHQLPVRVEKKEVKVYGPRSIKDNNSGKVFKSDDPNTDTPGIIHTEHALIARYLNPWSPGRYIYVFSGVHALGTYAIGDFLKEMDNYKKLPYKSQNSTAILEIEYEKWDPMACKYELKNIITL